MGKLCPRGGKREFRELESRHGCAEPGHESGELPREVADSGCGREEYCERGFYTSADRGGWLCNIRGKHEVPQSSPMVPRNPQSLLRHCDGRIRVRNTLPCRIQNLPP